MDQAILQFSAYIQEETQAQSLLLVSAIENGTVLDMDDFELILKVVKV